MRINACNTLNFAVFKPVYNYRKNNLNPSFTSELESIERGYTQTEIEMAKKYMRVKNAQKFIEEEMNSINLPISTASSAIELMGKYRQYEISRGKKLENLGNEIQKIDQRSIDITNRDKEIVAELENTGIKNATDKIKLIKTVTQEKRKKQVFDELNTKYIALQKLDEKIYPNAIMIKGMDDKAEQEEVIKFLRENNCEVYKLNFDDIPLEVVHKEINSCAKNIKNSGIHSLIVIENFDKYTVPTDENFDFINRLKGFLCSCSKNYDTTVLVFESHPERLDENIIGRHRFQKEIDVSKLKADNFCEFVPKYDGYSLIYDDDKNSHVDLYLANFGTNKHTLWIDSDNFVKIRKALDNIDRIRKIPRFKDVKKAQSPEPDNFSGLDGYMFYPENHLTADYKKIYSYSI